jgi:hypothetical protein
MIANITLDDGLILPHSANPTGSNFRERQWRRNARRRLFDLQIYSRLLTAVALNLVLNGLSFVE